MRRLVVALAVAFLVVLGGGSAAVAQPAPLLPDQVDAGVTAAIGQYVASLGYSYGGDCQLATPDLAGAECSLSYLQDDGSISVVLAVVQDDASAGPQVDQLLVAPAPAAASAPPPVSSIPAPAAQPSAPAPAPVAASAHMWYTSSFNTATTYYCDDDSAWHNLSPRYLQVYPSVAALLAVYPTKHLHRPCHDGATGP